MSSRSAVFTLFTAILIGVAVVTSLPAAGAHAAGSAGVVWEERTFTSADELRRFVTRGGASWERFLDRHPSIVARIRVSKPPTFRPALKWDGKTFVRVAALRQHLSRRGVDSTTFLKRHPAIASRVVGSLVPPRQPKPPAVPKPTKPPKPTPPAKPVPAPNPGTPPPAPTPGPAPTPPTTPTPPPPPTPTPPTPAPIPPASNPTSSAAAPAPPSPYQLPTPAAVVRTTAELQAALNGATKDIVLADGVYDSSTPFYNTNGHRIYAQNLGGAILRAGFVVGGNFGSGGGLLRGLRFDVSTASKTLGDGIVQVWGAGGASTKVLDCTFRGNRSIPYGLLVYNPSGFQARRLEFYDFTDVALRASNNTLVAYGGQTPKLTAISDIHVDGVSRPTPGSSHGTAEAGLWIGHPVTEGVRRVRIRNVSWAGLETVNNSWDTVFSDLDIDMSGPTQRAGVAVYMEHYNFNNTFENFTITGAKVGFTAEWADPATGGKPGANFVKIRNGSVDAAKSTLAGNQAGVYLDEGSHATSVKNVRFLNQNWAGIGAYRNSGTVDLEQNDFSKIKGTAKSIRFAHISG